VSTANIFSSWDWADVWWRHFGSRRSLELSLVRSGGRAAAVLPIYIERRGGITVRRFVGHGVADQLGPIATSNDLPLALQGIAAVGGGAGVLIADRFSVDPAWGLTGGRVVREESSPFIDLAAEAGWEEYLGRRSADFRQQARRRARRVARAGISYRLAQDPDRLQLDFSALLSLHAARWGPASEAFSGRRQAFHREFAARALKQGWLRLWLAEADDRPVAAWYGFRFGGIESYYQSGRDPQWDRLSVGAAMLEHTIREAFSDGMREYRLLRGNDPYKRRYARLETPLRTIVLGPEVAGRVAASVVPVIATTAAGRRILGRLAN
jgi:CelD/BcsL family acetyltransferase involved in cellulose biosynthesis